MKIILIILCGLNVLGGLIKLSRGQAEEVFVVSRRDRIIKTVIYALLIVGIWFWL